MINWLKGWRGIAVGAVFIVLSILYNSAFKSQIAESIPMQIPGYFLIGLGCALVMYAALASSDPKKEDEAPSETENSPSEEENK